MTFRVGRQISLIHPRAGERDTFSSGEDPAVTHRYARSTWRALVQ